MYKEHIDGCIKDIMMDVQITLTKIMIVRDKSISILADFTQGNEELLLYSEFLNTKPIESHTTVKHGNSSLF